MQLLAEFADQIRYKLLPMKTQLRYLFLFCCSAASLNAQIPNYSFESWGEFRQFTPQKWVANGMIQRVPGNQGSALRLAHEPMTLPSFVALADLSAGGFFGLPLPGFSYNTVPDSVSVLMRTNLGVGDTAQVLVIFTKAGNPMSIETMRIWGNSSGNWVRKGMRFGNSGVAADSGIILISSVAVDMVANQSGYLDVDSILFLDAAKKAMPPLPNAGFSLWDSLVLVQPDRYLSSDRLYSKTGYIVQTVLRENKARTGAYALKLQTAKTIGPNGTDTLGAIAISSATLNPLDADPERPSFPVNARYASFRGFYQLNTQGDTAEAEVNLFHQGNLVGNGIWRGAANTSGWTEFSAAINYDQLFSGTPDSASVILSLMNSDGTSSRPGNWFMLDDLYFSAWSTSLYGSSVNTLNARLYPNPARDRVFVNFLSPAPGLLHYTLVDVSGRKVNSGQFNVQDAGPQQLMLPLQSLPAGHYLLQLHIGAHFYQERILVQP